MRHAFRARTASSFCLTFICALLIGLVQTSAADQTLTWVSADVHFKYGWITYYRADPSAPWYPNSSYHTIDGSWGGSFDWSPYLNDQYPYFVSLSSRPTSSPYSVHASGFGHVARTEGVGILSYDTSSSDSFVQLVFDTTTPFNYAVDFTGLHADWQLSLNSQPVSAASGVLAPGRWTFRTGVNSYYDGEYDTTLTLSEVPEPSCLAAVAGGGIFVVRRRRR